MFVGRDISDKVEPVAENFEECVLQCRDDEGIDRFADLPVLSDKLGPHVRYDRVCHRESHVALEQGHLQLVEGVGDVLLRDYEFPFGDQDLDLVDKTGALCRSSCWFRRRGGRQWPP